MSEPTVLDVFGVNASQTATDLVIKKSDLTSTTFIPSANNSAESLFAALLMKAAEALTETARATNIDQSIAVGDDFSSSVATRNNDKYLRNAISIELDKLLVGANVIHPNDY